MSRVCRWEDVFFRGLHCAIGRRNPAFSLSSDISLLRDLSIPFFRGSHWRLDRLPGYLGCGRAFDGRLRSADDLLCLIKLGLQPSDLSFQALHRLLGILVSLVAILVPARSPTLNGLPALAGIEIVYFDSEFPDLLLSS